jgi:L-ascorbate metabolism protein UlaG (beta-lactamase superfamily)
MKIIQLRSATIIIEWNDGTHLLVDPMLSPKGFGPSMRPVKSKRAGNPTVELPANAEDLLDKVTHALITHCQKGHFDHLDHHGRRFLRERQIPVFCTSVDSAYLQKRGLQVNEIALTETSSFFDGVITPIKCLHGAGVVGKLMAHGSGYVIKKAGEPVLYLAGDTIMTDDVRACLRQHLPDVSVIPAGGARLAIGGEIIMGLEDAIEFGKLNPGMTVANHLEALDHCVVTRSVLRRAAQVEGISNRFFIPFDGESLSF